MYINLANKSLALTDLCKLLVLLLKSSRDNGQHLLSQYLGIEDVDRRRLFHYEFDPKDDYEINNLAQANLDILIFIMEKGKLITGYSDENNESA